MIKPAATTVEYIRPEVKQANKQWTLIKDCLNGEIAIKAKRMTYLPIPSGSKLESVEELARYENYLTRANFYNATKQTIQGLIGQVFTRKPLIETPDYLEVLTKDVDGSAIDLIQLSKIAVNLVLSHGRSGILVDYSSSSDVLTKDEISKNGARPVLRIYNPWDIINWRYDVDDSNKKRLVLVVLREEYNVKDDEFSFTKAIQYRELRLVDGKYRIRIWRNLNGGQYTPSADIYPTNSKGETFNNLLFTFIGSENNTGDIDSPPIYDLAAINIAHYRNSADYEESVFMVGQPTPIVTGLDESWVKNVFKGGFRLGSTTAIPLPKNADCKLIVASANGLVKEAMEHKERQMVALGAKLVEQRQVQRTAMEAGIETSAESSTLVSVANNVSQAVAQAIMWAIQFERGSVDEKVSFILNTDFALNKMTPAELNGIIGSWLKGAISWDEMRSNIRKGNIELTEDEVAKQAIAIEMQSKANLEENSLENNNNLNN